MSIEQWIEDFNTAADYAFTREWFLSPLEYWWAPGKELFDRLFRTSGQPDQGFDEHLTPGIFRCVMNPQFRADMMVYAVMRQPAAKSFGVEIESGLLSFYGLDFLACLSQWIYVIEGYCRKLFSVKSSKHVGSQAWKVPYTGEDGPDLIIRSLSHRLAKYLDNIVFKSVQDPHIERLSRKLPVHGNVANKNFFSQKNCLLVLFVIDALLMIELTSNRQLPLVFEPASGDDIRIAKRRTLYLTQLREIFDDNNLLKIDVLKEHVTKNASK